MILNLRGVLVVKFSVLSVHLTVGSIFFKVPLDLVLRESPFYVGVEFVAALLPRLHVSVLHGFGGGGGREASVVVVVN